MHLETLLYMLLQSDRTVPPPGARPDFEALANEAHAHSVPNQWIKVPASQIRLGLDDPDKDSGPNRYFGWDNEKPQRSVHVPAFEAKARGITNGEYARYLKETKATRLPASWTVSTSRVDAAAKKTSRIGKPVTDAYLTDKSVRTVYGPVPLAYALDWPVMASYNELAGCAKWMGGRIPSLEEARSIYNYVDQLNRKDGGEVLASTIPAVNGYQASTVGYTYCASSADRYPDTYPMMASKRPRHHTLLVTMLPVPCKV